MVQLLAGTFLIALVHALIPNHWLPLVAVAKTEKWKSAVVLQTAIFSSGAHVAGTVLLGIVLGKLSNEFAAHYESFVHWFGASILIAFGLYYMLHRHGHRSGRAEAKAKKTSIRQWTLFFAVTMFLSPCLEVQSLFISAGIEGFSRTLMVAALYSVVSISGIVVLVMLSYRGLKIAQAGMFEKYEKQITGSVLIIVGTVTFFLH